MSIVKTTDIKVVAFNRHCGVRLMAEDKKQVAEQNVSYVQNHVHKGLRINTCDITHLYILSKVISSIQATAFSVLKRGDCTTSFLDLKFPIFTKEFTHSTN